MTQADTADAPSEPLPGPMQDWLRHLKPTAATRPHAGRLPRELHFLHELAGKAGQPLDKLANGHIRQFVARLHAQGRGPRSLAHAGRLARLLQMVGAIDGHGRQSGGRRARAKAPRALPKALSVDQTQALLDRAPAQVANEPAPCATRPCSNCFIPAACGCPSWSAWTCAMNAPRNTSRAAGSTWTKRRSWCWARAASAVRCPWARPRWRPCASGSRRGRS